MMSTKPDSALGISKAPNTKSAARVAVQPTSLLLTTKSSGITTFMAAFSHGTIHFTGLRIGFRKRSAEAGDDGLVKHLRVLVHVRHVDPHESQTRKTS